LPSFKNRLAFLNDKANLKDAKHSKSLEAASASVALKGPALRGEAFVFSWYSYILVA